MKTFLPIVIALLLLALGSCTEEIIKVEHQVDTVIVKQFVDRYFSNIDTVEIPTIVEVPTPTRQQDSIIYVTDTIYMQRIDSIFITRTVIDVDTVVVREHSYGDTLYITYGRGTQSVPGELFPMFLEFFNQSGKHGHEVYTGTILVEVVKMDAVMQAYSFVAYGQAFLRINDNLTTDESMLPLYRELSRLRLGKEYSQDTASVLYPFYSAHKIRWSNRGQYTAELEELF